MKSEIQRETLTKDDDSDSDYTLNDNGVWITVKGFSVHLTKTDEGVLVDIYAKNDEMSEAIASTYALDSESENDA